MLPRAIQWLVCPECGTELELRDESRIPESFGDEVMAGWLTCGGGHAFAVRDGVPRLLPGSVRSASELRDPERISASFSREWGHFDYGDRTWAQEVESRRDLFLRELQVAPEELKGARVLDAGCGNGSLSQAICDFGCDVIAIDVSDSVDGAFAHFGPRERGHPHFLQGDLMRHPIRPESVDFVYSSGVLHHNPDTRAAFESVLRTLKPGGKIYIWVYCKIPGLRHALKQALRSVVAPLPDRVKHALVCAWLPQAMLRQYLRTLLRRNAPEDQLKWRERLVLLLDHYTVTYRWEHTQEEVHGWYRELGLVDVATSEEREWGFGVVGRKAG